MPEMILMCTEMDNLDLHIFPYNSYVLLANRMPAVAFTFSPMLVMYFQGDGKYRTVFQKSYVIGTVRRLVGCRRTYARVFQLVRKEDL